MKIHSQPHLIAAGIAALVLLVAVNKLEFFGDVCYYIGSLSLMDGKCIPPAYYYAAWLAVIGFAGYGLFGDQSARRNPPPDAPTGS